MRIALLEDDPAQTELVTGWLASRDYLFNSFSKGAEFQAALANDTFDLLIVDWNLPDTTGIEVVNWVRNHTDWHIPILMVTSRDAEEDVVTALKAGADDYMTKPVSKAETLARVQALARRSNPAAQETRELALPPYVILPEERVITLDGEPVDLTTKEYDLALVFFQNVGRLLSRNYLMENVWGINVDLNTRTVDTHASRVRNKLKIRPEIGWRLKPVYHHGYRLEKLQDS